MTDTITTSRTRPDRPLSGHGTFAGRLLCSIGYDARLVVLGMQTMADAVTGQERTAIWRRDRARVVRPEAGVLFGYGLMSSVLGVLSWFLLMLLVMAVVRGPFYGFVALLFGFRGISWLHAALVRRLNGLAGRWVLPATISVCAGGMLLIWSWIQQL
jgi:hypothetical protein